MAFSSNGCNNMEGTVMSIMSASGAMVMVYSKLSWNSSRFIAKYSSAKSISCSRVTITSSLRYSTLRMNDEIWVITRSVWSGFMAQETLSHKVESVLKKVWIDLRSECLHLLFAD